MTESQARVLKACLSLENKGKDVVLRNLKDELKEHATTTIDQMFDKLHRFKFLKATRKLGPNNTKVFKVTPHGKDSLGKFLRDINSEKTPSSSLVKSIKRKNLSYLVLKAVFDSQPVSIKTVTLKMGRDSGNLSMCFSSLMKNGLVEREKIDNTFMYSVSQKVLDRAGIDLSD